MPETISAFDHAAAAETEAGEDIVDWDTGRQNQHIGRDGMNTLLKKYFPTWELFQART